MRDQTGSAPLVSRADTGEPCGDAQGQVGVACRIGVERPSDRGAVVVEFEIQGHPLRLVATRANTHPAFGCYFRGVSADVARPYGLLVLTLAGPQISALTWFAATTGFASFGLPLELPTPKS